MNKTGRTTGISDSEAEALLEFGIPKGKVAKKMRVSRVTLWRWLRKGRIIPGRKVPVRREAS